MAIWSRSGGILSGVYTSLTTPPSSIIQRHPGFSPVLTVPDISPEEISINDLTAAADGKLYLATDDGIYIWKDNRVYRHLTRFEGIGTSDVVRTITIDAKNRVWFSTYGYVGFYREQAENQDALPIAMVTPTSESLPVITWETLIPQNATLLPPAGEDTNRSSGSAQQGFAPVLDPILKAINAILAKAGLLPAS